MTDLESQARRLFRLLRRHPVVESLAAAAGATPAHLVGGLLRDRLLGLPSRDFDVVVAGGGRAIAEAVAGALGATLVLLGGKEFAAFRVVGPDWVLDLWDRESQSLSGDLARRDFTVNSFALALGDGEIVDPFGGLGDLARRLLRATTRDSFTGDPLRVLRLPRLLARLPGFAAEPATLELARAAAPGLASVAAERVREELVLIFKSDEAARALALMAALDIYPGLWRGTPGDHGESGAAVRELGALPAAVRGLRAIDRLAAEAVDLLVARFAATFAGPGPEPALRFAEAGYMTRRVAERVARVLAEPGLPAGEQEQRRLLHRLGELWPTAAVRLGAAARARSAASSTPGADATGAGAAEEHRRRLAAIAALAERDGEQIFDPPRLLSGGEVQELLGVGPGPRVGEALSAVRREQVAGRVRTREQAVAVVERLARAARS